MTKVFMAVFGLILSVSCGGRPAATPSGSGSSEELCPGESDDVTVFEPPIPYEPTEPSCREWIARKSGLCRAELLNAMDVKKSRSMAATPRLTFFHLAAECQCFDERRRSIESCLEAVSCEAFAACSVALANDGWLPDSFD